MKMDAEPTTLEPRPSIINLRMIGFAKRNATRALYRKSEEQHRRNQLFRLKTAPMIGLQSKIFRDNNAFCCGTCTPLSRKNAIQKCFGAWDIQNILLIQNEQCGFITSRIKHLVHSWNINGFEYPDVSKTVLETKSVNVAIDEAIELELKNRPENESETLQKKFESQALQIVENLSSKISDGMRRFAFWVLAKVLPRVFHRVLVHPVQMNMLQNATQNDLPLVFLPAHRSRLDHILISFALISCGIKAPLVASEDDLNTPLIGWFSKVLGAFYMKSNADSENPIFRTVLHSYLVENLRAGQSVEFFLEGECSRSGKISPPKNEMLPSFVNALTDKSVKDAMIVPVSINYEQSPNAFDNASSLKNWTSLLTVIWSFLRSNYGMVRIDFGQPFSWREFEESFKKSTSFGRRNLSLDLKPNGDFETGYESREHFSRQNSNGVVNLYSKEQFLARHVLFDCDHNTAIMSTNAVAYLLLHQYRNGVTLSDLAGALEDLRFDVIASKRTVGFTGRNVDVVKYALNLLGPKLVQVETSTDGTETHIRPITHQLPAVFELNYYSNGVSSLYLLEAVIATAVCSLLNNSTWLCNEKCIVNKDELLQRALDICDILQFEFIFTKPCKLLQTTISNVIDSFITKAMLTLEADVLAEREGNYRQRRYGVDSFNFDGNDDYVPPTMRINYYGSEECRPMFQALCSILRPLIETYTVCAACLKGLVKTQVSREDLLDRIRAQAEAYLEEGLIHYQESMSMDPINNALRLFQQWTVLECNTHDKETYYCLTKKYDNYSRVHSVFEKMFSLLCEVE